MEEQNKKMDKAELERLSHELTYRRYMMDRGKIRSLFKNIRIPEYIALYSIAQDSEKASIYGDRTYLQELSEKMQLSMRQTSKMVGDLRDRGLVIWSHDGNGSEGTYVTITPAGEEKLQEQEDVLKKFYGSVIESFGTEKLIQLLQLMQELETTMSLAFEKMEDKDAEDIG